MTAPAGGATVTTLTPGAGPTLITEYAPGPDDTLNLINDSQTRVYVGADSSVSPSNGVPIDGGTSLPWATPGQLWAIADPTATNPATLRATTAIDDWQPSPYAIAAATAAELLATGIPSVLTTDIVYNGPIPVQEGPLNISGFAELTIVKPAAMKLGIGQSSDPFDLVLSYSETVGVGLTSMLIPAGDMYLTLINENAAAGTVIVIGSNRAPRARFDCRSNNGLIDLWNVPGGAQTFAASSTTPLTHQTTNVVVAGPVFGWFYFPAASAPCAYRVVDASGNTMFVCDSGEAITAFNGNRICTKNLAVPITGIVGMQLVMGTTAATFSPQVQLVAASDMP